MVRIDLPDTRFNPFGDNLSDDAIVDEEVPYSAYKDDTEGVSTRVILRNGVSSY